MKDERLHVRVSGELNDKLEATVAELIEKGIQPKATKADLTRQGIERWIDTYEATKDGNIQIILETQDFHTRDLAELQELLFNNARETDNIKIRDVLLDLDDRLNSRSDEIHQRTIESKRKLLSQFND